MQNLRLSTSYKKHFLVACIISVWLVVFLVLIAPFDIAELPFLIRLEILPFYGVISCSAYLLLIPIQNWIFSKLSKWTIVLEILFIGVFNTMAWIGSYFYYKSDIINGEYTFTKFTTEVYYPIFFVLLSILIFARWFLNRKSPKKPIEKIVLTGDNKLDILQINLVDLICISSADNYIEVYYLKDKNLQKKLLRNTLKNIHTNLPNLLKVHRSHLINPIHFKEWKDSKTLSLTQIEVPISKKYKETILTITDSSLKSNHSPQTP